jgi:hypothetical protein
MKQSVAKNSTEVLKAALWMLENIGWTKDKAAEVSHGKYKSFCAFGAINMVYVKNNKDVLRDEACKQLKEAMGAEDYADVMNDIILFNDSPTTTKEMVISAFKRAIKRNK